MRVVQSPVSSPSFNFTDFDLAKYEKSLKEYRDKIALLLQRAGYLGPFTGRIVRFPVADGYAEYMYADKPGKPVLVHMPYGDAWQYPDVKWIPAAEIKKRIEKQERLAKVFQSGNY